MSTNIERINEIKLWDWVKISRGVTVSHKQDDVPDKYVFTSANFNFVV
jgi:hypothetical protein